MSFLEILQVHDVVFALMMPTTGKKNLAQPNKDHFLIKKKMFHYKHTLSYIKNWLILGMFLTQPIIDIFFLSFWANFSLSVLRNKFLIYKFIN